MTKKLGLTKMMYYNDINIILNNSMQIIRVVMNNIFFIGKIFINKKCVDNKLNVLLKGL